MSNPLNDILGGVADVFESVIDTIKENPVLGIAAIYFTGGAAGLWSTPFTTAATTAATTSGTAGSTGVLASEMAAATTAGEAATLATVAPNTAQALSGISTVAGAAPSVTVPLMAPTIIPGTSLLGIAQDAGTSILNFMDKHPAGALIAGNMLSSAFTPTAAEQQAEIDAERRKSSSYYGVGGTATEGAGSSVEGLFTAVRKPLAPRSPGILSGAMTGGR